MNRSAALWIGLFAVAAAAIAIDIVVHRRSRPEMSSRRALLESAAWISLALLFGVGVFIVRGPKLFAAYLAGYLVEQCLSLDNLFVFLIVFHSFGIPARAQHKVLYYGVAGALILRAAFVFAGAALLNRFQPLIYVFGAILFVTAVRMILPRRDKGSEDTWIIRVARRLFPVSENANGKHFFVRENGRRVATSLFLALLAVEIADVIFAVDSIPAVLAITRDTFIVYSSNLFAVLGLRAIYFVLAGWLRKFRFLHQGLAAVLFFTGLEMVLSNWISLPPEISLAVIAGIFAVAILASLAVGPAASDA
jgi:tellurite resistance protein TerC